jgi:hypothetical protein
MLETYLSSPYDQESLSGGVRKGRVFFVDCVDFQNYIPKVFLKRRDITTDQREKDAYLGPIVKFGFSRAA